MTNEHENAQNEELENSVAESAVSEEVVSEETVAEEAVNAEAEVSAEENSEENSQADGSFKHTLNQIRGKKMCKYGKIAIAAVCAIIVLVLAIVAAVTIYNKVTYVPENEFELLTFREGLIAAKKDGKWGFINKKGKAVIDFKYDEVKNFDENGLAAVAIKEENDDGEEELLWGYINKKGDTVVKCKYSSAAHFDPFYDLAIVSIKDKDEDEKDVTYYGVINGKGEEIFSISKSKYVNAEILKDGYIRVCKEEKVGKFIEKTERKCGLLNKNGETVIDVKYDALLKQISDVDTIVIGEYDGDYDDADREMKYGVANLKGETIVKAKYDDIINFNENGLGWYGEIVDGDMYYGILNKKGEKVTKAKYDIADGFNEFDIARVGEETKSGERVYGLVNAKGEEILKPEYSHISSFSEDGFAIIQEIEVDKNDNETKVYGLVNNKGEVILKPEYDKIGSIHEENDLILVAKEDGKDKVTGEVLYEYGYINKKGEEVIECQYASASEFYNGVALIKENKNDDFLMLINEKGKVVYSPEDDDYVLGSLPAENGLVLVSKTDKDDKTLYGFTNKKGEIVIDCDYSIAVDFGNYGITAVHEDKENKETGEQAGNFFFINKKGEQVGDEYAYIFTDSFRYKEMKFALQTISTTAFMHDGYTFVVEANKDKLGVGIVNSKGKLVVDTEFEDILITVMAYGENKTWSTADQSIMEDAWKYVTVNKDFNGESWLKKYYESKAGKEFVEEYITNALSAFYKGDELIEKVNEYLEDSEKMAKIYATITEISGFGKIPIEWREQFSK